MSDERRAYVVMESDPWEEHGWPIAVFLTKEAAVAYVETANAEEQAKAKRGHRSRNFYLDLDDVPLLD